MELQQPALLANHGNLEGAVRKAHDYGTQPLKNGFDLSYKDARNNCVDFTWSALNHANIKRTEPDKSLGAIEQEGPAH
jgi:hypothetical protein